MWKTFCTCSMTHSTSYTLVKRRNYWMLYSNLRITAYLNSTFHQISLQTVKVRCHTESQILLLIYCMKTLEISAAVAIWIVTPQNTFRIQLYCEEGSSGFLWNSGNQLPDCMISPYRRPWYKWRACVKQNLNISELYFVILHMAEWQTLLGPRG
jgi:hypothetical protein